jgi:hypothetical protein
MNIENMIQTMIANGEITQQEIDSGIAALQKQFASDTNTVYGKVQVLTEKVPLQNPDEIYKSITDINSIPLDDLKTLKINQLSYLCNQAILAGFNSSALGTSHFYDFEYEDQQNINAMLNLIGNNMATEPITWKASGVPTDHTIAQFKTLCADAFVFKNSKIGAYWTLKAQVQSATDAATVNSINWS